MLIRLMCKPGVQFYGFSRALLRILDVLDQVTGLQIAGCPHAITITSGSDGKHAEGSAHYRHEAVDVRTKDFRTPEAKRAFADMVRAQLGPDFFVDLEQEGHPNEHLHVQLRKGRRFDLPAAVAGRLVRADGTLD